MALEVCAEGEVALRRLLREVESLNESLSLAS